MGRIVILPDVVVGRIAAGEVIQRPASVVKELIDNALDAGARRVEVRLEKGGRQLIVVRDDGWGMDAEDAVLAFERHATSKVRTVEDLMAIRTLGFRGEALASIAAVAHVVLETRPPEAEVGTRVEIVGGRLRSVTPAATAAGTVVQVRTLFMNVPARRKFLAAPSVELAHVLEIVQNYALAYPDRTFHLWHDGREVFLYPAVAEAIERVRQVYGAEAARSLIPLALETPDGSVVGWVSPPDAGGFRSDGMHVFVNGRVVRDRFLLQTFREGWQRYGARRPYPLLVAYLTWPPEAMDVNVHPTKMEVRFRDPERVQELIWTALDQAFQARRPVPQWAPPERLPVRTEPRSPSFGSPRPSSPTPVVPIRSPSTPSGVVGTEVSSPVVSVTQARIGQWARCYLVVLEPEAILLLDQHLVHERYLYEQWVASPQAVPTQALLMPIPVEVGVADAAFLAGCSDRLRRLGWQLEPFGPGAVTVHAVPLGVLADSVPEVVLQLRSILESAPRDPAVGWDDLLKTMACKAAVKMGMELSPDRQTALWEMWHALKVPQVCPHGRRMALRIPLTKVHHLFGRTWHGESTP